MRPEPIHRVRAWCVRPSLRVEGNVAGGLGVARL